MVVGIDAKSIGQVMCIKDEELEDLMGEAEVKATVSRVRVLHLG